MPVFDYDPPERFVTGTVGEPGQRTFFLQARGGGQVTSVALEKQQVAVLADRVEELLDEVVRRSGGTAPVPAIAPADQIDNEPLDVPIEEDFRVASMSLTWDGERDVVIIECHEVAEPDELEDEDAGEDEQQVAGAAPEEGLVLRPAAGSVLRVSITGAQARVFAHRAAAVVAQGRPPCPFCGSPLDPEGHICPRSNGYRR
jgi:uncharacterized repeat protein (TIGR03847 family)